MFKYNAEFNDMIQNIQGSTEDLLSYQEPGRSQTEWKKLKYANTKMTEMLELPDKDFEAAMIIMLQQAIMNTLKWKKWKTSAKK